MTVEIIAVGVCTGLIVTVVTALVPRSRSWWLRLVWRPVRDRYRAVKYRNAVLMVHTFDEDGNPTVAPANAETTAAHDRGVAARTRELVEDGTIDPEWLEKPQE